jgi:hypothetical protein
LPEQVHSGRSKEKKSSVGFSTAASPVNDAAERLEYLRRPVYLVQDHQLVFMISQVLTGIRELHPIVLVLKIEVNGFPLLGNLQRQRRFSRLARAQKGHRWIVLQ